MFHYKEIDPSCFYSHSNKTQNDIQRVPMKTNDCFLIRSLKNYDPSIQTNNDVLYLVPEYNTSNSNNTILTIHKLDSSFQSKLDPSKSVVNIHDQLNIQSGYEPQINERRNPGNLDQIYRITNGQQRYITEIKLYLYNNRIMNSEHLNDSISEGISYVKAIPCKIIHSQYNHSAKVHYPQDISLPFVSATNSVSVSFTLPSLKGIEDCSNSSKDSYRYSTKQSIGIQFKLFEQTQELKEIVIQTTYNDMETCFQAKKSKYSSEKTFVSLNEQQNNDGSFSSKQTPNQGTYNQGESNSLNDNIVNYVNQRGEFDNVDTIDIDNRTYVCSCHHFCCLSEQTNSTLKV
ncbi:unnamed protein product [Schistosoma rodhaini]|nr:unnamed protein product [Schistosoma rodhaini]